MKDNPTAIVVLALVAAAAIAVEFGLVSGGLYDFLRMALIIGLIVVIVIIGAIIAFLVYAGKKAGEPQTGNNPKVTVRRSSDSATRAKSDARIIGEGPMPTSLDDAFIREHAQEGQASAGVTGDNADESD